MVEDAGASAKTLARPGLQRALQALREGRADALLVAKLDRLTRSVRDLGQLVEEHFASGRAALLSVSEQIDTRSAAGRLVLNVLGSVSQWEREAIGERTRDAMRHLKASGARLGRPRYGFRVEGGELVPVPEEQEVIATVRALAASGRTQRAIVSELAARGVVSRVGRPLQLTQVSRILNA